MELHTFKTLWGQADIRNGQTLVTACDRALADGFDGVEGQVPGDGVVRDAFGDALDQRSLAFIAEICTAGSYVPDRTAPLADHLRDLDRQLAAAAPLRPLRVNCIGGCDRWNLETSLAFFDAALELADKHALAISFETHRGRSLYSPWVAEALLAKRPLPLTCDFSHWCVVCEGLGESEDDLIRQVAEHAHHIHGRVGYDQGPQVSDPQAPRYQDDLNKHLRWWRWIWQAQKRQGLSLSTMTPEFGPDGYQMVEPISGRPVGDLNAMNHWMAQRVTAEFSVALGEN